MIPKKYEQWHNDWYYAWGLSKEPITPFTSATDGMVFDEISENPYHEMVTQMPIMPAQDAAKSMIENGIDELEEMRVYEIAIVKILKYQNGKCVIM